MVSSRNAEVTPPPTDADLVRSAAGGDGTAFRALVDRHSAALFRLAVALAGNRADAEDALQETYLGAFRGLGTFGGRASVKTWLTQILIWQAGRVRHRRRRPAVAVDGLTPGVGAGGEWPRPLMLPPPDVGRRMDLSDVIGRLAPAHRAVVLLRDVEGLAYDEIAGLLGVPRGTVQSRLHRAHAWLGRRLGEYRPRAAPPSTRPGAGGRGSRRPGGESKGEQAPPGSALM